MGANCRHRATASPSGGKLEFMMTILSRDKCHILGPFIAESNCILSSINLNTKNPTIKKIYGSKMYKIQFSNRFYCF